MKTDDLFSEGFIILRNVYDTDTLQKCRHDILTYIHDNPTGALKCDQGISITNFVNINALSNVKYLKDSANLHNVLKDIFNGDEYRYCHHNDIGVNRIVGWHKDKLNGPYAKYETTDIWSTYNDTRQEIYKVLIYLQDSEGGHGPQLVPKSHKTKEISGNGSINLDLKMGDILIFDQRISHRGANIQAKSDRILISFGFGKNNIFTENFEKGTIARQNKQDTRFTNKIGCQM